MPFCPKCKAEYQPGYTKCFDCKCDLVEELSDTETIFSVKSSRLVERFRTYLDYSNLTIDTSVNEETGHIDISCQEKDRERITRAFETFVSSELFRLGKYQATMSDADSIEQISEMDDDSFDLTSASSDTSDDKDDEDYLEDLQENFEKREVPLILSKEKAFKSYREQAEDSRSTSLMFACLTPFIGLLFVLSVLDVLPLNSLASVVLAVMIVAFIAVSVIERLKYKNELLPKAEEQDKRITEIKQYLKDELSLESIRSIISDSDELLTEGYVNEGTPEYYFMINKVISDQLKEHFPDDDPSLLTELANTHFDELSI